jgi:mannosyl-3-phosphoglycerate phosphatase
MPCFIVFTDLDGTLLDHTYSYEAAKPALTALEQNGIPLVLVSSKTRAEIERLRARMRHHDPFIVENGGAAVIPTAVFDRPPPHATTIGGYHTIAFGAPYSKLRTALIDIAQAMGVTVRGFGDMTVEEIEARTGLSREEADLARQREYDEPFDVVGGSVTIEKLREEARLRGLECTRGGRFYHLLGSTDKGKACRYLIDCYRREWGGECTTIAVGDSLNDLPMLASVDRPILVQRQDGSFEGTIELPHLVRMNGVGPRGWNAAILQQVGA